jgi:hypothetical protein
LSAMATAIVCLNDKFCGGSKPYLRSYSSSANYLNHLMIYS